MRFDTFYLYSASGVHVESWKVQEYSLHFHSDIELQLFLEGSVECHVGRHIYVLKDGDIMLVNRNQPHSLVAPNANCSAIWLAINPSFCSTYFPSLTKIRFNEVFFDRAHPLNQVLRDCIVELAHCYQLKDEIYVFKLNEILNRMLFLLLSQHQYTRLTDAEVDLEQRKQTRILQVIDYIEQNYADQPRLEDLAERMDLSPDYLSHFINKAMGVTFREYLNHIRLRHAIELMQKQPVSQLDILLQTGFSDYRYFRRSFQKTYGCAPEDYPLH